MPHEKQMIQVPLLDLKAQYASIQKELDDAVLEVIRSQHFILGPKVEACEAAIASYCGARFAVGVSSGTDALLIALMCEGIGPGDEVVTTPYTFFATAGSVARLGAKPVFVDIDPGTFNMNPALVETRLTPKTKAIMPVHLYGQCADMDPIMALAAKRGLCVIEDAAQAIGAVYRGKKAGAIGHYGCFSFFPSKNLGGFGDGGMVVTPSEEKFKKLKIFRVHGSQPKYFHSVIGGNFRLDALQAAAVTVKLKHLDAWSEKRRRNAETYQRLFKESDLTPERGIFVPPVREERHIFNQFVVRVPRRDELMKFLASRKVGCEIYYPLPLHLQECFRYLGYKEGDFPESEKAAKETLALPVYPELTHEQIEYVVECIREFYGA